MLTNNGKNLLLRYLANLSPGFVKEIAVGIGDSTTSASSSRLDFEVSRTTVVTGSILGTTNEILYHSSLPTDDEYQIREIALFPTTSSQAGVPVRGTLITSFEPGDGAVFNSPSIIPSGQIASSYIEKTSSEEGAAGIRIGSSASYVCSSSGEVSLPALGDFSQYGPNDEINIAFITPVNSFNLSIELFDTLGQSMTITCSKNSLTDGVFTENNNTIRGVVNDETTHYYVIYSKPIGTQSINFSEMSQIKITNNGSSHVIIDGIRFEEVDLVNPLNSAVARKEILSPQDKLSGFSMDLEYRLTVG